MYINLTHSLYAHLYQEVGHKLNNTSVFCVQCLLLHSTGMETFGNHEGVPDTFMVFEEKEYIKAVQRVPSEGGQQEVLKQSCERRTGSLILVLVVVRLRNYILARHLCYTHMLDGVVYAEDEEKVENRHAYADVHY